MILVNIVLNTVLGGIFVYANTWALANQLEETFVTFAFFYAVITILLNAFFLHFVLNKKRRKEENKNKVNSS